MPDLVRAQLTNGTQVTVGAAHAKRLRLRVLDKPAVDRYGRVLSAKRQAFPKSKPAEKKETDQ